MQRGTRLDETIFNNRRTVRKADRLEQEKFTTKFPRFYKSIPSSIGLVEHIRAGRPVFIEVISISSVLQDSGIS